ncbi:hypothetical protein PA598K_00462 [Paenibacillus sp. 598K]|nr:hypothetical protein PA598K_00462 [Paenibacillus sp. 598K]
MQHGSRRLILVSADGDRACLREAFPELEPYVGAELPELVLSDDPENRDESIATLSDGTQIQRDRDVILIGIIRYPKL